MHRICVAVMTCLAVVLVAGCSDDDPPSGNPSPTVSSSEATASASPTDNVEQTPVQVVRAFYRAMNQLIKDGDASAARALVTADCRTCDYEFDPILETFAAGGSYQLEGPGWKVKAVRLKEKGKSAAVVTAAYSGSPGRLIPTKSARPIPFGAEKSIVEIRLVHVPQGWRIKFIGYLE